MAPDPLAALLALKKSGTTLPGGQLVSSNVAEDDPSLLLPDPISLPGSDARDAAQKLKDYLSPPPEVQQARTMANMSRDPLMKSAHDQAQSDKLAQLIAPAQTTGEYGLASEQLKAQGAMDVESAKAQAARDVETLKAGAGGGLGFKPTATEQTLIDAAQTSFHTSDQLLQEFELKHPGVTANPDKFSSAADALPSWLGAQFFKRGAAAPTALSGDPTASTKTSQMISDMNIQIARAVATGRLSGPLLDQIKAGLPAKEFSDGENVKRIQNLRNTILPNLLTGVAEGHGVDPSVLLGPSIGSTATPDWSNDPHGIR